MTAKQAYKKLKKLIDAGHGNLKIGYFKHYDASFVHCHDFRVTKNGGYYERPGTKKTEDVVQIFPCPPLEGDDI